MISPFGVDHGYEVSKGLNPAIARATQTARRSAALRDYKGGIPAPAHAPKHAAGKHRGQPKSATSELLDSYKGGVPKASGGQSALGERLATAAKIPTARRDAALGAYKGGVPKPKGGQSALGQRLAAARKTEVHTPAVETAAQTKGPGFFSRNKGKLAAGGAAAVGGGAGAYAYDRKKG